MEVVKWRLADMGKLIHRYSYQRMKAVSMTDWQDVVPEKLVLKIAERHGEAGRRWRAELPEIIWRCARHWSLTMNPPFPAATYNYVAPVLLRDGTPAVLKAGFPNDRELMAEAEALRNYGGDGAVHLLQADLINGTLLLERAHPGTDLWQIQDEEEQITVAAALMRRLWRTPPLGATLIHASDWIERMVSVAPSVAQSGFPLHWVERAKVIWEELVVSGGEAVLLHGDLHQGNILAAKRESWLAIDPKGLIGPRVFDTIQLILNVAWRKQNSSERRKAIARHVARLAEHLAMEPGGIRSCGVVLSVLNGFWQAEEHGAGWDRELAIAGDFSAGI